MGQILLIFVGGALGIGALALAIGLPVSSLVVGVLGLSMAGRRDWVPVVYNVRSLTVRKISTLLTGLGLALVVFVFATVLMLSHGIKKTLASTGLDENVKILRKGAQSEVQSGINTELVKVLTSAPEIALAADGKPLASPEAVVLIFALR